MNDNELPGVSLVVIGKNEANNLEDTFNAILKMDYPPEKIEIIYVDTGSADKSVQIATQYAHRVFVEQSRWPTSGLARNRGLIEAKHEIIHFIDGDISISKDYLKQAVNRILLPEVDAVTGYFVEKRTDKFFNRIMDIRRDGINHQERFCESTNGGGTYLKSKLLLVNGYDERILKGQESDLGIRYREKGFRILFIDQIQGVHNFDINSVVDFMRFKYYYGKSGGYLLKAKSDVNDYIRSIQKAAQKILISNFFSLFVIITGLVSGIYLIPVAYYLARLGLLFYKVKLKQKKSNRALLHDLVQYFFLFSAFFGVLKVLVNKELTPGKKQVIH